MSEVDTGFTVPGSVVIFNASTYVGVSPKVLSRAGFVCTVCDAFDVRGSAGVDRPRLRDWNGRILSRL